jgi:hypothetical protein
MNMQHKRKTRLTIDCNGYLMFLFLFFYPLIYFVTLFFLIQSFYIDLIWD